MLLSSGCLIRKVSGDVCHSESDSGEPEMKYIFFGFLAVGFLFLSILAWIWSLRKEVKIQTAELKKSEERYRLLVENASEGVIVVVDKQVAFINPRALQITGYSEGELNAGKLAECIHPDDQNIIFDFYSNTLKREDVVLQYPFRIITGKDETRWILNNSVKIEWEKKTGVLNIFTDITESKQFEQQFIQTQKMEAIGQLAGGIAHDFNNILTAIMGYGNLLKMNIGKEEAIVRYADNILTAAERAANLTSSLLTFSRKQAIDQQPTNVNGVITSVEKLLSKLIGENIDFSVKCGGDKLIVMADSSQIIQVLMNLATNARDAMPRGGKFVISTDIVEIDDTFIKKHAYGRNGLYALISFEDTGVGMDEKTKARIFEPFFTTKDIGKGTGLGLATVYGVVKQQNGYINVKSELGKGTTFNIYLPIILSDLAEMKERENTSINGGSETILVAEDEEDIRQFIKEILEGYGYTVIEASDGEDAIEKFKENKHVIQMLMLDIIMPKKTGKYAYDEIRKLDSSIKAIFISGYTADFIQQQGVNGEEIRLLYKPITIDTLLSQVRQVLDEQ